MPKGEKDSEEKTSEETKDSEEESKEKEETSEEDKEEEADELLSKKVKVGNREVTVAQLVKDHSGLQAEYTKGQQVLKDPERLKAYLKSEFNVDLSVPEPEKKPELDDETKQTLEEGRKLGFITHEDLVTEKKLWKEELKLEIVLEALEDDIDGSDGRPAFDKVEIAQYMVDEGFRDPAKAYKDKYETELEAWNKKQETEGKEKAPFTEKPTPGEVKLPKGKTMGQLSDKEAHDVMVSMLEGK